MPSSKSSKAAGTGLKRRLPLNNPLAYMIIGVFTLISATLVYRTFAATTPVNGLTAEYYNTMDLSGTPALTRVDPQIDYNWGTNTPAPGINADKFSIRWSGQITVPTTGVYHFYTTSDDGARLWVNNTKLVGSWTDHSVTRDSGTIHLTAGQKYPIKMEYYENGVYAQAALQWTGPGITTAVTIPEEQLFTTTSSTEPVPTPTPTPATTKTPTPTATATPVSGTSPSGQAMPGAVAGWKQIFADDFSGTVPKGAFSDCNHNTDTPQAYCGGLKNYGAYYDNWWAYPNGWNDTAKSGADGNTGAPYGGVYHPEDTVSVANGVMSVRMYRPSTGGDNHVAAMVPRKCMAHKYGRYTERFKVVHADAGFKSAHLFYDGGYEIDYPENDYGDTIYAYTHPGGASFSAGTGYTNGWHTTTIEWTSASTKFYMDGKLIGTTSNRNPNIAMSWILQNESSILGPYAKNGAYAQLDTDWVACYSPA